jgi:hypothetical protein
MANIIRPNFSTPSVRTKYGSVINGKIYENACNIESEKKLDSNLFFSSFFVILLIFLINVFLLVS